MIFARLTDQLRNRNHKTAGSVRVQGYESWFPLTSVNFSLSGSDTSDKIPVAPASPTTSSSGSAQTPAVAAKKKSSGNSVSCEKFVDVATSALMYLSVCDKLKDRNGEQVAVDLLAADIHFVEVAASALGSSGKADQSHAVTFLKIALENVSVDGWSFSGSDDERPNESFNLKFERIAIQYIQYDDSGNMKPVNAHGFSQNPYEKWIPSSWKGK